MNTAPMGQAQIKQAMRLEAKARRCALSPEAIEEKSRTIADRLLALADGAGTVMVYVSKPPEVETAGLIDALLSAGKRVVVPIIEKERRTLRLSYLTDRSVLVESTFHVPEPIGSEVPASPDDLDLIVVPVVGFDRTGSRIGYGAGYYDRFLSRAPDVPVVGAAFSCQEVPSVPCEAFDRRMDLVVTEEEVIACSC
ncbi:MAG: 5-formyltetrahydrofolate cyclo-ligase [Methanofollis liminatans]|uniref:5-formyltetrahydrofolate cyclo-ligase n=1 Tax=Methanofollis liminatans DSM 4140 TaxID=28892 RepID=J1APM1_9EURY|nr:5-formyltetrahydrofolate cyclo-ligase [Methanofollis liminatans]EJG06838.1 5-formyltetrahydrofolate cyclo-ligase [Methanofollis liminatans DSM 4140]MDD3111959.1 5-formyltetrahydrofolate cyclo-ligase [Methanofollis liminatans]